MAVKNNANSRPVYSSDRGRLCPDCGRPVSRCSCPNKRRQAATPKDGIVRVGRETKGRKGKGVTIVAGLPLGEVELASLAKELKAKCGAGGSLKQGIIEIQGEHRDTIVRLLHDKGFTVKRAGG
jgi:translation initiation factor 1